MSIAPRHDRHKKCFAYCGDDRCNCSRRRQTKKGIIMTTTDTNNTDGAALLPVTHPIDMLREMLASEIKRTSTAESFMIRSGLLADLLDELASLRISHSLPGDVGMREADDADLAHAIQQLGFALRFDAAPGKEWQHVLSLEEAVAIYTALTPSPCPGDGMREEAAEARRVEAIALNQNDEMRQQLSHVGNMISDLARAMGVDQADADGGWPDLAGRIQKLIDAALTPSALSGDAGEACDHAGAFLLPGGLEAKCGACGAVGRVPLRKGPIPSHKGAGE